MFSTTFASVLVFALMIGLPALASDIGTPTPETLSAAYTGQVYSPYAKRNFPERPFWGDSHLHTDLSMHICLQGSLIPQLPQESEVIRGAGEIADRGEALAEILILCFLQEAQ